VDSFMNTRTQYRVDIRELGITKYMLWDKKGKLALEGNYSKFNLMQGVPIPDKIQVERSQENQYISINYKNMEVNKSDIYIDFKIPRDAAVIKI